MSETIADNQDAVRVTLGSSAYSIRAGTSVEIQVQIENTAPPGDFFEVKLLGIPSSWIAYSGPAAVWVSAGSQEKVVFSVCPPVEEENISGYYPARVQVTRQTAPDKLIQQEVLLSVLTVEGTKRITLAVESTEFLAAPGTQLKIPLTIRNIAPEADYLELSIQGVPLTWVSLPSPSIYLIPGEEKRVDLLLQIPTAPEIHTGVYPLKVSAASQNDPAVQDEIELKLGIAAFQSQGRVGVMMRTVQFSVAPGGTLAASLTVLNRGLEADVFHLDVEGIPVSWISTSSPVNPLDPGENKEFTLLVSPPLSPSSQAGRYKFSLTISSQVVPDQAVRVECTLTVTAYTQFRAELEPQEAGAGQTVMVSVQNEGNVQQVFHLACESQNDQLSFTYLPPEAPKDPGAPPGSRPRAPEAAPAEKVNDPTFLTVLPGESGTFRFTARPRQRQLLGGAASYPYLASVAAKQNEALTLPGRILSRGGIPAWVLPVVLLLCLCLSFSGLFLLLQGGIQTNNATRTSVAGTAIAAGATQTLLASTAMSAGATQTIIANQTAAALAGQQDTDGDGLTDQREIEIATNPYNPDTDGDGLMDGEEVFQSGTNPFNPDSDLDGLKDGDEVRLRTNPLNADTDGDKSKDGDEVSLGTNPLDPDTDRDGLVDGGESPPCPSPLNPDSDKDSLIDGRDLSACDPNNPALTATAAALWPTATGAPPTAAPTQQPSQVPTSPPTQVSLPRFPGMVLFESDRDGNPEIYTVDDAGHIKRMTNSPSADIQAAWRPGMQQLAFTSNRDGQNEIYLMNADGTNLVNLTNNPADDQQPTWSIDGQWVAFTSNRAGNYEIYILQLSNFEIRNLTNSPGNDTQPNWLRSTTLDPGGESIVFTSDRDGNLEIYRMKTDGAEPVNLTANPASDQMAKGSKDGALLMFTTNRDGNNEIYTMKTDGSALSNLTNNPAADFGPSWSPDDVWAAFTTNRDGNNEVYLLTRPGMPELYNLTKYPGSDQGSDWR